LKPDSVSWSGSRKAKKIHKKWKNDTFLVSATLNVFCGCLQTSPAAGKSFMDAEEENKLKFLSTRNVIFFSYQKPGSLVEAVKEIPYVTVVIPKNVILSMANFYIFGHQKTWVRMRYPDSP
jgi:hypothetical protein